MERKQWLILILCVLMLGITVWTVSYFVSNKDKAQEYVKKEEKEQEKEQEADLEEIKKKLETDEKIVTKEEISDYVKDLDSDSEKFYTNTELAEKIEKKYGKVNREAFEGNYAYSQRDSDFIKGQKELYYKMLSSKSKAIEILPYLDIHVNYSVLSEGDKTDPYVLYSEEDINTLNFYDDTEKFKSEGKYKVGYPMLNSEQKLARVQEEEYTEKAQRKNKDFGDYVNYVTVEFYVQVEEDMKLEDAVKEFSNFDVKVNGTKAEHSLKLHPLNEEEYPDKKRKALSDLEGKKGKTYLPKNGVVKVVYDFSLMDAVSEESTGMTTEEFNEKYADGTLTFDVTIGKADFTLKSPKRIEGDIRLQK